MMKYKGYLGQVVYDDEARLFHGDVIGIRAVITFQGQSVGELEKAFKDSIDDYIAWCAERNVEPEKPFSGDLKIRVSPSDYERLSREAADRSMSLDSYIMEQLRIRSR